MADQLRAECNDCQRGVTWVSCPTGGWWAHDVHPENGHTADTDRLVHETMDDDGVMVTHGFLAWRDIDPATMMNEQLPWRGVVGPMSDTGERCPWPWDPQQLVGAPLGQYHCPYCGSMVMAGMAHLDYDEDAS